MNIFGAGNISEDAAAFFSRMLGLFDVGGEHCAGVVGKLDSLPPGAVIAPLPLVIPRTGAGYFLSKEPRSEPHAPPTNLPIESHRATLVPPTNLPIKVTLYNVISMFLHV